MPLISHMYTTTATAPAPLRTAARHQPALLPVSHAPRALSWDPSPAAALVSRATRTAAAADPLLLLSTRLPPLARLPTPSAMLLSSEATRLSATPRRLLAVPPPLCARTRVCAACSCHLPHAAPATSAPLPAPTSRRRYCATPLLEAAPPAMRPRAASLPAARMTRPSALMG